MYDQLLWKKEMSNHWRTQDINLFGFFKPLVIIVCTTLLASQTFSKIIEKPENGTYPEGTDIVLSCVVEGATENIIWKDVEKDIRIFIGRSKNTMKDKYRNFFISDLQGNYSLIISDATKADEGVYSCNEMDTSYLAKVTIEVLPSLNLYASGTPIISVTDQVRSNVGDEFVDTTIFWKILGVWTLLILVICCVVALLQWALQRSCSHGNGYCGATCSNKSFTATAEFRNCERTADNGEMIFERTMVNDLGLTYAVPNIQSFSKNPDVVIHEDQNRTNYATVITTFGPEEHL